MFKFVVLALAISAVHCQYGGYHKQEAPDHKEEEYYDNPKYSFEYSVHSPHTGDIKSQKEERDGEHTQGLYKLVEPDGSVREVHYSVEGKSGFLAEVQKEAGKGPEPSYYKPQQPSYQKAEPSYYKPQPSYQKAEPSYYKPQPSYQKAEPSYYKPQPSYQKAEPSYYKPQPSYQKAEPSFYKPQPSYQKAEPSYYKPQPSYQKAEPSYYKPAYKPSY